MKKTLDYYTTQAISCLDNASKIAYYNNKKLITADSLFRWVYAFLQQQRLLSLFFAVIGLKKTKSLDTLFQKEIQVPMLQAEQKLLPLNKPLSNALKIKLKENNKRTDPFWLFLIAFSLISPKLKKLIQKEGNNLEEIRNTLDYLSTIPVVNEQGIFAFLEIIDMLISELNLDYKDIQNMNIQYENINKIDEILDNMESEIVEKSDSDDISLETGDQKPKKKEEKSWLLNILGQILPERQKMAIWTLLLEEKKRLIR